MRSIYTVEDIELQDWNDENGNPKPVRIYPLVIKKFKKLAEILDQLQNPPEVKEGQKEKTFLDVITEATAYAMKTYEPALGTISKVEEHFDMPTMEHVLDIAAGVKLNDPNLAAAMTAGKS
jgi:hypothetical protein